MLLIMKIYITTYIHIWKKHISDFIVIYDKRRKKKNIDTGGSLQGGSKGLKEEKKKANTETTKLMSTHTYIFLYKSFTDQIEYKSFFEVNYQAKESIVEAHGSKTIQIIISIVHLVKAWGNVILYVKAIDCPSCSEF